MAKYKPLGPNDVDSYQNLESMGRVVDPKGLGRVQYGDTGTIQGTEKLPITDTQRARRNFEGYEKNQWYSLAELQEGAIGGTTEIDSVTEDEASHKGKHGYGYAQQQKSGKGGRPYKTSAKHKKEN